MKKTIKKLVVLVTVTILGTSIPANAEWRQSSNGLWWNTEGNSWSIGWRYIDSKWYYFDSNGYMKTGWLNDNGTWYYLNTSGDMATNTITPDGYKVDEKGAWIKVDTITNTSSTNNTSTTQSSGDSKSVSSSSDSTIDDIKEQVRRRQKEYADSISINQDSIDVIYYKSDLRIRTVANDGEGVTKVTGYTEDNKDWYQQIYGVLKIKASDYGMTPVQIYDAVLFREPQIVKNDDGSVRMVIIPRNGGAPIESKSSSSSSGNTTPTTPVIEPIVTPTTTSSSAIITPITTSSAVVMN